MLRRTEVAALRRELDRRGASGWIVGGAARDLLLGRDVPDVDVAVDSDPYALARALEAAGVGTCVPLSESDPRVARVVRAVRPGGRREIDVAELVGQTIEQDLGRRDFTANAIAIPLDAPSTRIDPFGGERDLAARRLRMISEENLRDDPLRAWRGARFIATHGLVPDARTTAACRRTAPRLASAAPERVRTELEKLLAADRAVPALAWAARTGLLGEALGIPLSPARAREVAKGPFDAPALVRRAPARRAVLRLALLASRCGLDPDEVPPWLAGRRFPRDTARRVGNLVALARRARVPEDETARWRWVRDAGPDAIDAVALARWIAASAQAGTAIDAHARAARAARVPPRVTGKDILEWVGGTPGPAVGAWLREIEIEGLRGTIATRAAARKWLLGRAGSSESGVRPTGKGAAGL